MSAAAPARAPTKRKAGASKAKGKAAKIKKKSKAPFGSTGAGGLTLDAAEQPATYGERGRLRRNANNETMAPVLEGGKYLIDRTAPKGPHMRHVGYGRFRDNLANMMYGFGDVKDDHQIPASQVLMEQLVTEHIAGVTAKAMDIAMLRGGTLDKACFEFVMRHDAERLRRASHIWVPKDEDS